MLDLTSSSDIDKVVVNIDQTKVAKCRQCQMKMEVQMSGTNCPELLSEEDLNILL